MSIRARGKSLSVGSWMFGWFIIATKAAADSYGLEVATVWWSFGMLLVAAYFVYAYRLFFRPR
jgi:hypothetical protein